MMGNVVIVRVCWHCMWYMRAGEVWWGVESLPENDWSSLVWSSQTEAEEVEAVAGSAASSGSCASTCASCHWRTSRSAPAAATAACTADGKSAAAAASAAAGDVVMLTGSWNSEAAVSRCQLFDWVCCGQHDYNWVCVQNKWILK